MGRNREHGGNKIGIGTSAVAPEIPRGNRSELRPASPGSSSGQFGIWPAMCFREAMRSHLAPGHCSYLKGKKPPTNILISGRDDTGQWMQGAGSKRSWKCSPSKSKPDPRAREPMTNPTEKRRQARLRKARICDNVGQKTPEHGGNKIQIMEETKFQLRRKQNSKYDSSLL